MLTSEKNDEEAARSLPNGTASRNHESDILKRDYIPTPSTLLKITPRQIRTCISTTAHRCFTFLTPSFLQPDGFEPRIHPTSHLDGIRGVAAFLVVIAHMVDNYYDCRSTYWGGAPGQNTSILQLPIVSLIYAGNPWVSVFFVLSGYSLSIKPIKLMREGLWEKLHDTQASAAFRRTLRLYLPCVASTFMIMCFLQLDFYAYTQTWATAPGAVGRWKGLHPRKLDAGWSAQLQDWYTRLWSMIAVFTFDTEAGRHAYDSHLFTIPIELRCSLIVFLCQTAFSRKRPVVRMLLFGLVTWFAHHFGRWDVVLFLAGPILVELDIIASSGAGWHTQSATTPEGKSSKYWATHIVWSSVFLVSLVLLSYPLEGAESAWIFGSLSKAIPSQYQPIWRYWPMWGSILFLASINNLALLARFFNLPPIQYLGKISFSIYLVHSALLHTAGYCLEMFVFNSVFHVQLPQDKYTVKFNAAFVLAASFNAAMFVWAADIFMRSVDVPSVRFARWLDMKGRSAL
jgi:peptidoglycan/LPS O-acetylase OafA/YrhL